MDINVDVIVVGGGGAGMSAAIASVENGANTVLLEKNSHLGGTTILSVGSITVSDTQFQARAGIKDSPQEHFNDMSLFIPESMRDKENYELRKVLVDNVKETFEWLQKIGVRFHGPFPEPPHSKKRMHNVIPNSKAYGYYLSRECIRKGVDVKLNTKVTELLYNGDRVVGVQACVDGRASNIYSKYGVVISSGDFSNSESLKAEFRPDVAHVDGYNSSSTGDGQKMAIEIGSEVVNGDLIWGPSLRFKEAPKPSLIKRLPPHPWLTALMQFGLEKLPMKFFRPFILQFMTSSLSPEPSLFERGAILVNEEGDRFSDERNKPEPEVARQKGKLAFIVMDKNLKEKFEEWPNFVSTAPGVAYAYMSDYKKTRSDIFHEGNNLEVLSKRIGVNYRSLKGAVDKVNEERRDGTNGLPEIKEPPFYALGPVMSWVVIAEGGLKVNSEHQVVQKGGCPIKGLYAAGSSGQGGLILAGHGHHIGWAMTSGRRAGKFVVSHN
ncbi:FAD-dependent oxidoreductase [Halomonas sp. HAL1]|uniref:FAD-dependent oxidoreductase n=1 Tax=Halomonas sp. HAL1 TaxID=550984 RepID=UPI00022D3036|nr:FAD-dependent oxidoreductase [Halomonas sp. HAL1]EHA13635.1 flavocytochrome c [Halomonas sp. HAL1]WKV91613.1 FAD-dependent oxidoreductase [Halomonas sp. HAL1]